MKLWLLCIMLAIFMSTAVLAISNETGDNVTSADSAWSSGISIEIFISFIGLILSAIGVIYLISDRKTKRKIANRDSLQNEMNLLQNEMNLLIEPIRAMEYIVKTAKKRSDWHAYYNSWYKQNRTITPAHRHYAEKFVKATEKMDKNKYLGPKELRISIDSYLICKNKAEKLAQGEIEGDTNLSDEFDSAAKDLFDEANIRYEENSNKLDILNSELK